MNNYFFQITITDIASVVINILTLLFAYKIYRNFDVQKSHVNKQLDTVLSLVQEINNTLIPVYFWRKVPSEHLNKLPKEIQEKSRAALEIWYLSLFIISISENKDQKFESVFLNADIKQVLPFLSYMNNPLLPNVIAQKLSAFYSPFTNYSSFEKASDKYVVLHSQTKVENALDFQYPDFTNSFKNWNGFVQCANELKQEIENWLNKYGSKDINFNLYIQHPIK